MDWLKKAQEAVEGLGRQASKQAEILSLHNEIGKRENELERQYAQAGRRARDLVRAQQLMDDEIRVIIERTKKLDAEVMDLRRQIHELDKGEPGGGESQGRKCPQCGESVAEDSRFCESCGAKLT
jgi:methyl-accepting chemotaxis protein